MVKWEKGRAGRQIEESTGGEREKEREIDREREMPKKKEGEGESGLAVVGERRRGADGRLVGLRGTQEHVRRKIWQRLPPTI